MRWLSVFTLLLLTLMSACSVSPTPEPVIVTVIVTSTPTHTPSPTPAPCCADTSGFPPVCNILPGQSTAEDVERVLGSPPYVEPVRADEGRNIPGGAALDTRWVYPYACPVTVFLSNEIVSVVVYPLREVKTLEEAVAAYGPPEKVQLIWSYPVLEEPGDYWNVAFLWPTAGVLMEAGTERPIDPQEVPPFQGSLRVAPVWYFQPTDVERAVSAFYGGELLVEWPGMTE